ncbi:cellulase N-terminal Ig-like domain-containing protein [Cellulomonas soli]
MPTVPRVLLDQLGQRPGVPFSATLVTDASGPVGWHLEREGQVLATGTSTPCGHDPSAGLSVHVLQVGPLNQTGEGWRLHADGATSDPFRVADDLHVALAHDALRFFHLQRSGVEIGPEVAGPRTRDPRVTRRRARTAATPVCRACRRGVRSPRTASTCTRAGPTTTCST